MNRPLRAYHRPRSSYWKKGPPENMISVPSSLGKSIVVFLLCYIQFSLYAEDPSGSESSWIKEGEVLLETKQFAEAEKLANSILGSNPSDSKAEFLLTRAWIGLGREEGQKGNLASAKNYLERAYEKWPLNEDLQKEISELGKDSPTKMGIRGQARQFPSSFPWVEWRSGMESLRTEISGLRTEISELKAELMSIRTQGSRILFSILALLCVQSIVQILVLFKKSK
ncbi:hypothetical protein EHQ53_04860 [Leptospira langatensis]|uniref:Uncharacterized protein n=1 Tax=Leptospira langatensis TaxID=2484983 RepID=A0A5F1ZYG6_9LEPT|nr:hypothetical protein [Leptospira langatensis]TGK00147.1 hypothetical protein EHO57_12720 [Leptospira langatensis]TGL42782.1 hypothetical protein EHQ53_04860 [Leptospira langatensis]